MSPTTVDQTMATIALFEETTGHRDFGAFHIEQARKFKRRMDARGIMYRRKGNIHGFDGVTLRDDSDD